MSFGFRVFNQFRKRDAYSTVYKPIFHEEITLISGFIEAIRINNGIGLI